MYSVNCHRNPFLQTDPIGYEAGLNLYAFVGNDPINWADPLGLEGVIVVTACKLTNTRCLDPTTGITGGVPSLVTTLPHREDIGGPGERERTEEEEKAEEEECNEIDQAVNDTQSSLSNFITKFPVWNDISRLQSQLNWVKRDLAEFGILNWVALGTTTASGAATLSGRIPSGGLGRFGGAIGLAISSGLGAMSIWQSKNLQNQVNALNARLRQLKAKRSGRCD